MPSYNCDSVVKSEQHTVIPSTLTCVLFPLVQASWTNASKKQREKLLELIRRLAEDDKDGVMAHKVLNLLWNLAHSDDVPVDIMDQALSAHIKILDYSCSQVNVGLFLVNVLQNNR